MGAGPSKSGAAPIGAAGGGGRAGATQEPASQTRSPLQSVSMLHCARALDANSSEPATPPRSPKTVRKDIRLTIARVRQRQQGFRQPLN